MYSTTNVLFKGLCIVAWLIFVGLTIEAGGLVVNFVFHIINPGFVKNLYQKLDLRGTYQFSKNAFYSIYSFILATAILKCILFYWVILLITKFDLRRPFTTFVSAKISQISYITFSIGLLSYICRQTASTLYHQGLDISNITHFWADGQAFILMAAVIYIIAAIFRKGIELQNENDLTV